jgi:hypothetical protein
MIHFVGISKSTMNINSQHHSLLGNQISPKSEDFCIWQPFCTLVTMPTAAIYNFFNAPKAVTHYDLVERDKPKKSESVGQTFPQLPWKQKRGH